MFLQFHQQPLNPLLLYHKKGWIPLKRAPAPHSRKGKIPLLATAALDILDLTEDPLSSNFPRKEQLDDSTNLNPSTSNSLPNEGSDSAPRAKTGYSANYLDLPYTLPGDFQVTENSTLWKKADSFRPSRPLILQRIVKDYKSILDPLEVHGALALHLIKAMNASYALACRADLLDDARQEAAIKEKKEETSQAMVEIKKHDALQTRFTRLEVEHFDISRKLGRLQLVHNQTTKKVQKAIFDYQRSAEFRLEADKEAAYCLCCFTKTYRDVNPSIIANYEDFIQEYPEEWFAPLDLSGPLTPIAEERDPSATADPLPLDT
ncbi:hypothetical protein LIER_17425 [Lithospermum erythrorhizon]|uniref:Uncharacterized protein n=1 Tax=Lithospermum erythrorhizon TaxID=34254 RepID=A0AAV3QCL1_LITER